MDEKSMRNEGLKMKNSERMEKVQFMWNNYLESDSSEFWKRNNYPANCRFLKYDYEELGPVQKMADMFNFWMSIMLLRHSISFGCCEVDG